MQDTLTIPERDTEHERVLGIVFGLSPAQASVLSCLTRGTVATTEQLLEYCGVKPPIKVVVSRTREKMRSHNVAINSKIGVGYWIDKMHRQLIERKVAEFLEVG